MSCCRLALPVSELAPDGGVRDVEDDPRAPAVLLAWMAGAVAATSVRARDMDGEGRCCDGDAKLRARDTDGDEDDTDADERAAITGDTALATTCHPAPGAAGSAAPGDASAPAPAAASAGLGRTKRW